MTRLLEWYRTMLLIRRFEETVEQLFSRGVIQGTTHPAIGQEAVAVGVSAGLRKGDYVTSTHRGHGHFIARGGDPDRIMAELFGKRTGYSQGRGGSQLMADFKIGFLGANGITGAGLPLATGVALSAVRRGTDRVTACFFGDGAANQGTFHEALNLAAIWKLPVVYVCENNRYAMSMPVQNAVPVADIAERAAGYGFPGRVVDGNDPLAVRAAVREACARARAGDGPTLVECKTYRLSGHSRGDPRVYRSKEEEAAWRRRDPIKLFRRELKRRGCLDAVSDKQLRRDVNQQVREAVRFARSSEYPDPGTVNEGLFA